MFQITVDGCCYNIIKDCSRIFDLEYLAVIGVDGLVGTAQVDHNMEVINVSYQLEEGEEDVVYNYYEYLNDSDAKRNLATWIVSTHPTN